MGSGIRCYTTVLSVKAVLSCLLLPAHIRLHVQEETATDPRQWYLSFICPFHHAWVISVESIKRCPMKMWKLMPLRSVLLFNLLIEQNWKTVMGKILGSLSLTWTRPRWVAVHREDSTFNACVIQNLPFLL